MPRTIKMPRTVRGKRPQFFDTPTEDLSISMIMVLAQELSVLRARMDAFENIAANKGLVLEEEVKSYQPSNDALADQEKWRQDLLNRLFYLLHQQASEATKGETGKAFQETIDEIAEP